MAKSLAAVVFFSLLVQAAQKSEVVAWVTQCNGDWEERISGKQPVKIACTGVRGELWLPLSRDSKLVLTSHRAKQWINVRVATTGEKHRFDCDQPDQCEPPPLPFIRFVPKQEDTRALQPFFESPGSAYARVRLLLSKSENDESARVTVDHAVIAEGTRIRLRDVVRPASPTGEYLLELCPFDEKKGCPTYGRPVSLKWVPDSVATWPDSVSAGLYEIVLSKVVNGITMRTPDRGLLLVVPKQTVAAVREEVQAGEHILLEDWKDPTEGHLMFQALLVRLASPGK